MESGKVETKLAETRIAWILNGLGLLRLRQRRYAEVLKFSSCMRGIFTLWKIHSI